MSAIETTFSFVEENHFQPPYTLEFTQKINEITEAITATLNEKKFVQEGEGSWY